LAHLHDFFPANTLSASEVPEREERVMGKDEGLGMGCGEWFGLEAVLLVALALRPQGIQTESAYWDEVASRRYLDAPGVVEFVRQVRADDPPMVPFYFAAEYAWAKACGTGLVTVRMLSVLLGLVSLVLVYLLGRRIFGRVAGLIAGNWLGHCCEVRGFGIHGFPTMALTMFSKMSLPCLTEVDR
jgi:hypothetical protein